MSEQDGVKIWPTENKGVKVSIKDTAEELTESEAINLAYRSVLHLGNHEVLSGLSALWREAQEREREERNRAAKEYYELLDSVSRSYFEAGYTSLSPKRAHIVEDFAKAKLEIKKLTEAK